MASRIDVSLAEMRKEAAQRETRLVLAMAVMIGLAVAVLSLLIGLSTD